MMSYFTLLKNICIFLLFLQVNSVIAATVSVRVSEDRDDAEERGTAPGRVTRTNTVLELNYDASIRQVIGLRFQSVAIPQGATINSAYVEFEADSTDSGTTNLVIYGEDVDDAPQFVNSRGNISDRTKTAASVNWAVPSWSTVSAKEQSVDMASIIQEIVNRGGWSSGNSMVIIIEPGVGCVSNSCQREAESFSGEPANAPLLVIDYTVVPPPPPPPPVPLAYFAMDELVWDGTADEVVDSSGNNNHGVRVGSANTVDPGQVCRGGDIPFNTTNAAQDAIDTGLDVDADIGPIGTISFWYNSDNIWNGGGSRMLFDASTTNNNKYFFLVLQSNGRLAFRLEDSADRDFSTTTFTQPFAAGTWQHIAATWDLSNDQIAIYVNGVLAAGNTINSTGRLRRLGTLYLGDNRSTYHPSGTASSANGVLDEVRIYDVVQTASEIQADMNATHACSPPVICGVFADNFSSSSYANNDGTANFAGGWDEFEGTSVTVPEAVPDPTSGHVQVTGGRLQIDNYSPESGNQPGAERQLDLSAYTSATLSFDFQTTGGVEADDSILVRASSDGGSNWTVLENITGIGDTSGSRSYDLTPYISANTKIGFRMSSTINSGACCYGGVGETITFDNINISTCLADHLSINHDGTAVNCQAENITLSAHDSSHVVDGTYTGTVNLTTSTNHGDWAYVSGGNAANLTNSGNGAATYTFDGSEGGTVDLSLKNTFAETISIDVTDGSVTETSGAATMADDPNLVYAAAGFQFLADSVANDIGTQIAGKASDAGYGNQTLELQAIRTGPTGACEAALDGNVNIGLGFECENADTCQRDMYIGATSPATPVTGTDTDVVTPIAYTNVLLDFGDATDTTASFVLNYPDAGQVKLSAQHTLTPSNETITGSSNSFVSRPLGFVVAATGNPAANSAAGDTYRRASEDFTVTVAGALWNAAADSDDNGIPDNHDDTDPSNNDDLSGNSVTLDSTVYTGTPNFGQEGEEVLLSADLILPSLVPNDGDFNGGTTISSFTSGGGSTATAEFDDVGIIEIKAAINDSNYLGIGMPETANMLSRSGYVGRFYPHHFALNNSFIVNRSDVTGGVTSMFTYMDENFQVLYMLTAQNEDNGTTENYTTAGGFAFLDTAGELNYGAVDTVTPTALTGRLTTGTPIISWVGGVLNITDTMSIDRDMIPDGPYTLTNIGIAPTDDDMVPLNTFDIDVDGDTTNDRGRIGTTDVRFGRMNIQNAHGSELVALNVPFQAEFFDGAGFVVNPLDNLTAFTMANLTLSNAVEMVGETDGDILVQPGRTSVGTIANNPLVNGDTELSFCPPGNPACNPTPGASGHIDINVDVSAYSYLQYDWDDTDGNNDGPYDDNPPTARITFGIYRGNPKHIYIRELY